MAMIPLVSYLALTPAPHLVAHECTGCGARYFDRRNACAACPGTDFRPADLATEGTVRTFTIVHMAAPGVRVPFVAAVVDCGGTRCAPTSSTCPPTRTTCGSACPSGSRSTRSAPTMR